jgi:hypothetical protein
MNEKNYHLASVAVYFFFCSALISRETLSMVTVIWLKSSLILSKMALFLACSEKFIAYSFQTVSLKVFSVSSYSFSDYYDF